MANRVNVKKKVGLPRRVTRLAACSHFCEGRVTLLADQRFSMQTLWLAQLGQLGQGETIKECANTVGSDKGVNYFFPFTQLEGDPLFRDNFALFERGLKGWDKTTV